MKSSKTGKRHKLLLYKRSMDRLWGWTLVLGLLLAALWFIQYWWDLSVFKTNNSVYLIAGSVVCLGFSLFAFLARSMAYVQAKADHIQIVTPFLKLKVSYRRVRSIHPTSFQSLFPPDKAGWLQQRFLEPFYGQTVVVVDLSTFPAKERSLRLFLPEQMFSPRGKGFVMVVPDWMEFSTELDSFNGRWLQTQVAKEKTGRTARAY